MKTEFELRVLDIDVKVIREKLEVIGAKFISSRIMKRRIYLPKDTSEIRWLRIRDEGDKVTLTYKERSSDTIDGTKELEVEVSDFEKTYLIFEKMGFECESYQENKRETYFLNGIYFEIDTWPFVPSYLEVEGSSKEEVEYYTNLISDDKSKIVSISPDKIFKKYGLDFKKMKNLRFEEQN